MQANSAPKIYKKEKTFLNVRKDRNIGIKN